jgi:hypothetical protein
MTRESQNTPSQREIRVLVTDRPLLAVLRKQPTGMGGLGKGCFLGWSNSNDSLPALRLLCYTNHPVASLVMGSDVPPNLHCRPASKEKHAQQEDCPCSYHKSGHEPPNFVIYTYYTTDT